MYISKDWKTAQLIFKRPQRHVLKVYHHGVCDCRSEMCMYSHDGDTHFDEHKCYGWTPRRMSVDVESQVPDFGIVHKNTAVSTLPAPLQSWGRSGDRCRKTPTLRSCATEIIARSTEVQPEVMYNLSEHVRLSFVREIPTYHRMYLRSSCSVKHMGVSYRSSVNK